MDASELTPKDVGRVVKTQWDDGECYGILTEVDHPDDPGVHGARMLLFDNGKWTEQCVAFEQIVEIGNHIPEVKLELTEPV